MDTFREPVHACIHPETYKYYVDPTRVAATWEALETLISPLEIDPTFGVRQVRSKRLIVRAPPAGNPITVIRRRGCGLGDVRALHRVLGFDDPTEAIRQDEHPS